VWKGLLGLRWGEDGRWKVKVKVKVKLEREGIDRRATNRYEKACSRINKIFRTEKEFFFPKEINIGISDSQCSFLCSFKKPTPPPRNRETLGLWEFATGFIYIYIYIYISQSKSVLFRGGNKAYRDLESRGGGLERLREESVEGTGMSTWLFCRRGDGRLVCCCDGENWEGEMREKDGLGWGRGSWVGDVGWKDGKRIYFREFRK